MAEQNIINIQLVGKDYASKDIKKVSKEIGELTGSAKNSGVSLGKMAGAFGLALGAVQVASGVFSSITGSINRMTSSALALSEEIITVGGEFKTLEATARRTAQNLDMESEFDSLIEGLAQTNTFGSNAVKTVDTFIRSGLVKLTDSLQRLNPVTGETVTGLDAFVLTAKDLSAAAGISSSEGIAKLTKAIKMQNGELLDSMGITGSLVVEYKNMAETLGKNSAELTELEKNQAILNLIMREGEKVVGAYDVANESLSKRLRSVNDLTKSLKELLGASIEPIFSALVGRLLEFGKAFREGLIDRIQEVQPAIDRMMQALVRLGMELGIQGSTIKDFGKSVADLVVDGLIAGINAVTGFVDGFKNGMPGIREEWDKLSGTITTALQIFGVTNDGIVSGLGETSDSLVGAEGKAYDLGTAFGNTAAGGLTEVLGKLDEFGQFIIDNEEDIRAFANAVITIAGAFMSVASAIQTVQDKVVALADKWNSLPDIVQWMLNPFVKGSQELSRAVWSTPKGATPDQVASIPTQSVSRSVAIGEGRFANGGVVGGSSYNGDRVLARVNSGEMILNKEQQAELFRMANGGGGGNGGGKDVVINNNFSGGVTPEAVANTLAFQLRFNS